MSNEVLNAALGFQPPYTWELSPLVTVMGNSSNVIKQSVIHSTHDWMTFGVNTDLMTTAQQATLMNFVRAMLGNGDNFLFQDSYGVGYAVARQSIGTGDGSDDTWQLYQTVTSGSTTRNFDRWDIIAASVSVWVNNALQTEGVDYNLDYSSSGLITFIAGHIPGAVAIEAAFSYYRRCRFTGSLGGILRAYNAGGMQLTFAEEGI